MDGSAEGIEVDGMICFPKDTPPPEEPEEIDDDSLATCPKDPRFQQQNVTKWCYQMFIDFHRCTFLLGPKPECNYFKRCYLAICPNSWIEKWDEQIEDGSFPRDTRRDYYYRLP